MAPFEPDDNEAAAGATRSGPNPGGRLAHIIVFGNQKGGSGKSTAAMHVAVGLLRRGFRVGTIDLDVKQGTLSRYFANRRARANELAKQGNEDRLPCPTHASVPRSPAQSVADAERWERERLDTVIGEMAPVKDFIIIDTPGSDQYLSRYGHSLADMLITPINDSFVDLDLLAQIDPDTLEIQRPSVYAENVWEQRKQRAFRDRGSIDWIVMRNRLSHVDARNKRDIGEILDRLAKRIGFVLAPGFGERVIFRELFLKGLTMLDVKEDGETAMTMSHVAARQEVRALLDVIQPEKIIEEKERRLTLEAVGGNG